jgi:hypothetical protein
MHVFHTSLLTIMSKNKSHKVKHLRSTANDNSMKRISEKSRLESQSSNFQNDSDIKQEPSTASQESRDSVDHNGSKRNDYHLDISFDLAYADFEEELRQRANCRRRRRKEVESIDTLTSGYDKASTTKE